MVGKAGMVAGSIESPSSADGDGDGGGSGGGGVWLIRLGAGVEPGGGATVAPGQSGSGIPVFLFAVGMPADGLPRGVSGRRAGARVRGDDPGAGGARSVDLWGWNHPAAACAGERLLAHGLPSYGRPQDGAGAALGLERFRSERRYGVWATQRVWV